MPFWNNDGSKQRGEILPESFSSKRPILGVKVTKSPCKRNFFHEWTSPLCFDRLNHFHGAVLQTKKVWYILKNDVEPFCDLRHRKFCFAKKNVLPIFGAIFGRWAHIRSFPIKYTNFGHRPRESSEKHWKSSQFCFKMYKCPCETFLNTYVNLKQTLDTLSTRHFVWK